ncbi:50S ribosomal protein L24 [Spiroplasma platyhelix]|uniref:Large ribosomal subunit protein uL24 n=1 Tax=Spiroplasma platyhelix PALS-1 TaxID=1276218 RepID=A0A846TX74_9MOLU|nr:50S ribosomal protein L24 [Spiroplasma platyhelix]MBE4704289.1 50S ribosomal protein L24 [Spiroplasma platyhelix PALS-1]NKE38661.1 50S ribosomal protein L24 [Spiroplasma platyhelix PALS-1]UJB28873.1 50S ribosomal protein L24 [Spiroplasma platyhelix PALS-1]
MALGKKSKAIKILDTKLKKGDKVKIIAGKYKGTVAPIIKVLRDKNRVVIEGITMKKHQKPTQENQEGGIIEIPAPIHISNVQIIDGKSGKANKVSRLGYTFKDKKKIRVYRKSGSEA